VFITIFLLFYNFWPTLFVILFIILFSYFLLKLTNKKFKEWGIIRQNFSSKILQNLQESFGYIKEIILSGYQNFFLKRHSECNIENSKASIKRDVYSILPRPLLECITLLTFYFLILIFLTLKINKSEIFILIGIIFFASIKLLPSISNIIKSLQLVRYNFSSVNVIYDELKNIKIIPKNLKKNLRVMKFLKIEFNNVSFLYEGQKKNIIKNLSLKIKISDKIGIMGKSGSGKTTFLNLLAGLLSPISGVIKVNDLITDFGSSEWKRKIGYAHQNTFLADDTVLFNITFKNKIKKNEYSRLLKVLKVTELDDYIKTLEFGIHTKIGENGCQFSGGQRQRLGIARVLFKNPSMIILDEATSALDEQMENRILKSIFNKMKNQIIIIVSHRKNTLKHCNKQFLFANGRLFKR
jgi:ABC-type branched-subunit amino acid transport system ATPase component